MNTEQHGSISVTLGPKQVAALKLFAKTITEQTIPTARRRGEVAILAELMDAQLAIREMLAGRSV